MSDLYKILIKVDYGENEMIKKEISEWEFKILF